MAGFGTDLLGGLYRTYIVKNLLRDTSNIARKAWQNRDDADFFLKKVGLSTYSSTRDTFFGLSMLLLGALGGGLVALALAPKPGRELRADVKDKARQLIDRSPISSARRQEMRA